jgi:hypothetical protein
VIRPLLVVLLLASSTAYAGEPHAKLQLEGSYQRALETHFLMAGASAAGGYSWSRAGVYGRAAYARGETPFGLQMTAWTLGAYAEVQAARLRVMPGLDLRVFDITRATTGAGIVKWGAGPRLDVTIDLVEGLYAGASLHTVFLRQTSGLIDYRVEWGADAMIGWRF